MRDLIKFESHKMKRQKWFYISLAIMIAMLVITAYAQKLIPGAISGAIPDDPETLEAMGLTPEEAAEMKEAMAQLKSEERGTFILGAASSAMYTLLSAVFVSIVVCEDYDQQIVKNVFSRGYSRRSVYFSKAVCVFVSCTVMFIVIHLVAALLAVLLFVMKEIDPAIWKNLAVIYLVCMAFNAMQLAVSSIIRKAGGSIAICIVVPVLIGTLLGVVQTLLKIDSDKIMLSNYWLDSFLGAAADLETSGKRLTEIAVCSGIYIALFVFLGELFGRKAEA